ncbi:hypothetical protein YB2330_002863 [Saitoella coloradoensis]
MPRRPSHNDDSPMSRPSIGSQPRSSQSSSLSEFDFAEGLPDLDEDDHGGHGRTGNGMQKPLLGNIAAPAVTMAGGEESGDEEDQIKMPQEGGGLVNSFFNMSNSIIGAGIIGLPFAFKEAGLAMGIVLLIVLAIMTDWTIRLIILNAKLSGKDNYQDIVSHCFGPKGFFFCCLAQISFAYGGIAAFCVIIGDTIPHVLSALIPGLKDIPVIGLLANREAAIVFCTVFISYPLSLYRDISKLAKASALALVSMVVIILTVIIQGPRVPDTDDWRGRKVEWAVFDMGFFKAIGVISFAFVCHHNSLLIYGSLKKPTLNRFTTVTHWSMGISLGACLIMALAGYLNFKDKTVGNILVNFPPEGEPGSNLMVTFARFCFGFNCFTTLPLEAFVCREVVTSYYWRHTPFSLRRHVILTSCFVFSGMCISLLTTDLGIVLQLAGSTSAVALAYLFPTLCWLKEAEGPWWGWKKLPAVGCAAFGVIVMVVTSIEAIWSRL